MEFATAIKKIITSFRRWANQSLEKDDLTISQAEMLFFITQQEEQGNAVIQRNIEDALKLSNPTVSGTLDRLGRKGLIERVPDPANRRVNIVRRTDKAKRNRERMIAHMAKLEQKALQGFTEDEIRQLDALLSKVLKNISE